MKFLFFLLLFLLLLLHSKSLVCVNDILYPSLLCNFLIFFFEELRQVCAC